MAEVTLQQQADWWCQVYAAMKENGWLSGAENPGEQVIGGLKYLTHVGRSAELMGARVNKESAAHLANVAVVVDNCREAKCPWAFDLGSQNFKVGRIMVAAPSKGGMSKDHFERWVKVAVRDWVKHQSNRS